LQVNNFSQLVQRAREYEILGSQDLIIFEVNYVNWDEDLSNYKLKIHEGLYMERKPFADVLCFCKCFNICIGTTASTTQD